MNISIVITPSGRLHVAEAADGLPEVGDAAAASLEKAFEKSNAAGLLLLASQEMQLELPASLAFWRGLARGFFQAVCQLGEAGFGHWTTVAEPGAEHLEQLVADAPPTVGLEYLNVELLRSVWDELRERASAEAQKFSGGPAAYLRALSPLWHLLGRVTFHLAENKRDPQRPFAFLATYTHRLSGQARVAHLPLADALKTYASAKDISKLELLLEPVRRAAERSGLARELLDSKALFSPQAWSIRQAYRFLKEAPLVEEAGVVVRLPDWWRGRKPPRPQVQVSIGSKPASAVGLDRLLNFNIGMVLDGEPLTDEEHRQLLEGTEGLALLRGKWVEVDQQQLRQALDHWKHLAEDRPDGISFIEGMRLLAGAELDEPSPVGDELANWSRVTAGDWLRQTLERMREPRADKACQPGRDLNATLRPYQSEGVYWLWFMTELGLGACLADDMGLGKTIQVIDLLLQRKRAASRGSGGQAHFSASPSGTVPAARGRKMSQTPTGEDAPSLALQAGVDAASRDSGGQAHFSASPSGVAPAAKGRKMSQTPTGEDAPSLALQAGVGKHSPYQPEAPAKRTTTGHIAANSPSRAAPSLLVVPASLMGNWRQELARFAPQLNVFFAHRSETDVDDLARVADDPVGALAEFDLAITTYGMLRRQEWLAKVTWSVVVLDEAQAIKNSSSAQARGVKKLAGASRIVLTGTPVENHLGDLWSIFDFCSPGLLGTAAEFKKFIKRLNKQQDAQAYGTLRRLVRPYILRRMKTDPAIVPDLPEKTEMRTECGLSKKQAALYAQAVDDLKQRLEDAEGIARRGMVLAALMQFKQICNHPSQFLQRHDFPPEESGKFGRLALLCEPIAERQEKALVFTQFQSMTKPLADYLARVFGRPGLVLHGGTPVGKRAELVRTFQDDAGPPFFVISLKAGGSGLNLTAASHVIHFDRWWNPAVENQATDRAFRIGQRRNVLVHKFVCRGTVEERIDAMIDSKQAVADQILSQESEVRLTEMSNEELLRFVTLDIDRATAEEG